MTNCTGLSPRAPAGNDASIDKGADSGVEKDAGYDSGSDAGDGGAIEVDGGDAGVDSGDDAGVAEDAGADGGADGGFDAGPPPLWPIRDGKSASDQATAVAVDWSGSVYVTGFTSGDLYSSSGGGTDYFIAKFDSTGNNIWAQQVATAGDDKALAIALDTVGNPYVAGFVASGSTDAFLTRHDPTNGGVTWTQKVSTSAVDYGKAVALDPLGNVYLAGETFGFISDGGGGASDIFLARFESATGARAWALQYGSASNDYVGGMTVGVVPRLEDAGVGGVTAALYDIYVVGQTFTPGSLPGADSGGAAYIAQFDSDGGHDWTFQFGGSNDFARAVRTPPTPPTRYFILFETSVGFGGIPLLGGRDVFLVEYDTDFAIQNRIAVQSSANDWASGLAVNGAYAYFTGTTYGVVAAGADASAGSDIFIARFNYVNGTLDWVRQFGSSGGVGANGIALSAAGDLGYVVGSFDGGLLGLEAADASVDYFVLRFLNDGGF